MLVSSGDFKKDFIFILNSLMNNISYKLNYFLSTLIQYETICRCVKQGKYNKEAGKSNYPSSTCSEEHAIQKTLKMSVPDVQCIVCTFFEEASLVIKHLQEVVNKLPNVDIYYFRQIESIDELPFATGTNFRTCREYNMLLCKVSEHCLKMADENTWDIISELDGCIRSRFADHYLKFINEYKEYLITYCEMNDEKIQNIISVKKEFDQRIGSGKKDIYETHVFNLLLDDIVLYAKSLKSFKQKSYVFHMIWNNLFINYGYETVYTIISGNV